MRRGAEVHYLHGDHLGSTSLTTDAGGAVVSEGRYLPFGGSRWSSGSDVTDFGFTGQRNEAGFGLHDYNARYYSSSLGRFVSADTVVPNFGNPQSLNRYSYVYNNALKYTDPSGHIVCTIEESPGFNKCPSATNLFDLDLSDWSGFAQGVANLALSVVGLQYDNEQQVVRTPSFEEQVDSIGFAHPLGMASVVSGRAFKGSFAALLGEFGERAPIIQKSRSIPQNSFGSSWKHLGTLIDDGHFRPDDLLLYFDNDSLLQGVMNIGSTSSKIPGTNIEALKLLRFEGLGGGAGAALFKEAIEESQRRGFGGALLWESSEQALEWYTQRGAKEIPGSYNLMYLTPEDAQHFLDKLAK